MKIGFCSDVHDHESNLRRAMVEFQKRGTEAIIFAGDLTTPTMIDIFEIAGCPVYAVYGNCDRNRLLMQEKFKNIGQIFSEPHIFSINGFDIVVMHEPNWVESFASEHIGDIIVYGHIHEASIEEGNPLIINPGEVLGRRSGKATVAWLDTEINEVEVIRLEKLPEF